MTTLRRLALVGTFGFDGTLTGSVIPAAFAFGITITGYLLYVRHEKRLLDGTPEQVYKVKRRGVTIEQVEMGWRCEGYQGAKVVVEWEPNAIKCGLIPQPGSRRVVISPTHIVDDLRSYLPTRFAPVYLVKSGRRRLAR